MFLVRTIAERIEHRLMIIRMSNMNQAVLLVTGAAVSVVMGATGETAAGVAAIG